MIVAVCPAGAVTGGPEALHQLVDSVNRQGHEAAILYDPDGGVTPDPYRHYQTPTITEGEIPAGSLVVLPEIWPHEAARFGYCRTALWWLSVDNAAAGAHAAAVDVHLTQSDYARRYLTGLGVESLMVGDYISPIYNDSVAPRRAAVAYNPAKGADLAAEFGRLAPHIDLVPIKGMTAVEIAELLRSVSVYVDFGHHPGKDRLPREAAASGAVVFCRHAGATGNDVDLPLPPWFKFGADLDGLVARVEAVLADRSDAYATQVHYRRIVANERQQFDTEVRRLIRWYESPV